MRQQLLYYQLLKYSGHGTNIGDALDRAVDRLCAAQLLELSEVSVSIRLSALEHTCRALLGKVPIEIHQRCLEVQRSLPRARVSLDGVDLPTLLLGRALEAAGVAYGIHHFVEQYRPFLESRLYKTHGLTHLLVNHGAEAIANVANNINSFTLSYLANAKSEHGKLLALVAIRASNPEAYKIYVQRGWERWQYDHIKEASGTRTTSMCLDQKKPHTETLHLLPGRRSYSLDVRAGGEELSLDAIAA